VFLTSPDDAKNASVLSGARAIFEREGVPSVATVGDAASYGFVLINVLGQPPAADAACAVRAPRSRQFTGPVWTGRHR
jgi:hypothetical protein